MNDFYNLVAHRASCRAYRPEPIPEEVFQRVLEAGCKAPSAGGFQNYSIIRVKDPEVRKALTKVCRGQQFITAAPECLVLCVDYHRMDQTREIEPAPFQETDQFENFVMSIADVMIAAQTMVLAAESEHLGSCYIGNVLNAMDRVTELLRLPERVFPVILLTFGWPKSPRKQPPKYSPDLLVHEDYYQEQTPEQVYAAYRQHNRWQKFTASEKQLEKCCATAELLHGAEYAERVRQDIEQKGWMGSYQYWLGCYYLYQQLPNHMTNGEYLQYFKQHGFRWLESEYEEDTV